jgi:BlaI family transcriptional regulator, penicillinase repressor
LPRVLRDAPNPGELTDAEWRVMHAVWERSPTTVRDVHGALSASTDWAYTTVKTLMERLVRKGALTVRRAGPQGVFTSSLPRSRARLAAARALLKRAFGGSAAPLLHLLVTEERLSPDDRHELARLLAEPQRTSRPDPPAVDRAHASKRRGERP